LQALARRTAFGLQCHHVVLAGFASPGELHSAFDAITSFSPPGHDEAQPPEFRVALTDLGDLLGPRTNMPMTFVVWSARPIQPLMRMLVRPQGLAPGSAAVRRQARGGS